MWSKLRKRYSELSVPVRTSIIYVFCSVLQKGISFIAVPIYTRLVPSEEYGLYNLYNSWDAILSIFATLNMWNYLYSNGMLKYKDSKDRFTSSLIGLSSTLTLSLFLVYLIFRNQFEKISNIPFLAMVLMFGMFLLRPSYEYWCSRQRFEYNIKKYTISAITISLVTPLLTVLLILTFQRQNQNGGYALIIGKVVSAAIIYFIVKISLLKKSFKLYDKEVWSYALKFSLPLIPHFLSGVVLAQSDRIMIGSMCGTSKTAIYSVAYSCAAVLELFNAALMDSIIPWEYKKLESKDYSKIPKIATISLLFISGINLAVALCAPEVIAIMAPSEYQEAIYVIPPVAMSNVFMFMFNLYGNIEYYHEETKLVAGASCIAAVSNIILNYIFIKKFGFIAAGYTTVACYIIYSLSHYFFMNYTLKKHGVKQKVYNNQALWTISLISLCASIGFSFLYPHRVIRYSIIVALIILVIAFRNRIRNLYKEIKNHND